MQYINFDLAVDKIAEAHCVGFIAGNQVQGLHLEYWNPITNYNYEGGTQRLIIPVGQHYIR